MESQWSAKGNCLCAMTEMSTTTMNCNCGESTVYCSDEDEDQPKDPKREVLPEASRHMPNTYPLVNQEEH